jgi:nucleoside-diphosphate-sugar epimerase
MTLAQNSKPMVLVTGATGFVGSSLVEALLNKHYSVLCFVRSNSDIRALQKMPVRLLIGDLEDPSVLQNGACEIQTVYHVAGAIKAADRKGYFQTNQIGTRRLLEILAESTPALSRFIHVSSLAAAGPSPEGRALTEGEKPNPISWYGESKLQSELEVLKFANAFPVTIVRPSAVYGPRDRETLLIFRMVKHGCLFTPGRFTRRFSLIHVDDLTQALIQAGEHKTSSGEIFFVSRQETYTWDEVGRVIAKVLGRSYRRIAFPQILAQLAGVGGDLWSNARGRPASISSQKVKELLQPSWLCDSSKAMACLGFHPEIDLESGVRNTVRWYQDHGWL